MASKRLEIPKIFRDEKWLTSISNVYIFSAIRITNFFWNLRFFENSISWGREEFVGLFFELHRSFQSMKTFCERGKDLKIFLPLWMTSSRISKNFGIRRTWHFPGLNFQSPFEWFSGRPLWKYQQGVYRSVESNKVNSSRLIWKRGQLKSTI